MSEPVCLIFQPFERPLPYEAKIQSIFTDGVSYWVGWWSPTDACLYVKNANGTNGILDHSRIIAWAKLPNYFAITKYEGVNQ
jgi:hypothetical protein